MKAIITSRSIISRGYNLITENAPPHAAKIVTIPVPVPSPTQLLVKTSTVSLNPIDAKNIDLLAPNNSIIGCDFSGTITQIGSQVQGTWKVGDRVAGMVHGGLYPDVGSFAESLAVDGDLAWKIPNDTSNAEAATFGVAALAAMMGLNMRLGVQWPWMQPGAKNDEAILIYSASTAVGLFAVQLAAAAGVTVVATASPASTDLVKSYGADFVYDYKSPTAVAEIKKQFPNITKALDCISAGPSTDFCARVVQDNKGKVATLMADGKTKVPGVTVEMIMVFTVYEKSWQWLAPIGPKFDVKPGYRKDLVEFYHHLPDLISKKVLKAPPLEAIPGGLEGVLNGLDRYRTGNVKGKKLVVDIN